MSDLINRLRSYLPLGDGSLWSQSSKDIDLAAYALESAGKDIAELYEMNLAQAKTISALKSIAGEMAEALENNERFSKSFYDDEKEAIQQSSDALAKWKEFNRG